jgi:hypothetical protein
VQPHRLTLSISARSAHFAHFALLALFAALGLDLTACTNTPFVAAEPDASAEASVAKEGGADVGLEDSPGDTPTEAAGGACNTLTNTAPVVAEAALAAEAPTPAGGMVADGTYFLTAATVFTGKGGGTGPTGTRYQWVTKSTGDTYEVSLRITGRGASDSVTSGTSVTSGAKVTFTQTCPVVAVNATSTYGFDADGTSVTLYATSPGSVTSYVFAKQ